MSALERIRREGEREEDSGGEREEGAGEREEGAGGERALLDAAADEVQMGEGEGGVRLDGGDGRDGVHVGVGGGASSVYVMRQAQILKSTK